MVFALEGHALEVSDEFAAGGEIKPTVVYLSQIWPKVTYSTSLLGGANIPP